MIMSEALANYFETQLNDLVPTGAGYEFKIWAEAGEFKRYYKNGNDIIYYINGLLSLKGSALTPNMLVMGTNGVTVEFLVPVDTPKTGYNQTDEELARAKRAVLFYSTSRGNFAKIFYRCKKIINDRFRRRCIQHDGVFGGIDFRRNRYKNHYRRSHAYDGIHNIKFRQ